jgi:hypothetical protein
MRETISNEAIKGFASALRRLERTAAHEEAMLSVAQLCIKRSSRELDYLIKSALKPKNLLLPVALRIMQHYGLSERAAVMLHDCICLSDDFPFHLLSEMIEVFPELIESTAMRKCVSFLVRNESSNSEARQRCVDSFASHPIESLDTIVESFFANAATLLSGNERSLARLLSFLLMCRERCDLKRQFRKRCCAADACCACWMELGIQQLDRSQNVGLVRAWSER